MPGSARLRADREIPADLPAPGAPIADRMNIVMPETVRPADGPSLVNKEEPPGKPVEERPDEEQPALHVVTLIEAQNELGTAIQPFAESHPFKEDDSAKPIASGQTESSETVAQAHLNDGPLLSSTGTSPECEAPAAGLKTPVIYDPEPPETAIELPAAATLTAGDGAPAAYTIQMTEVGCALSCRDGNRPSQEALLIRWQAFKNREHIG